jgi:glutaredoxin
MNYLSQKGVSFTAKDVSANHAAAEELRRLNSNSTPTIVVDGHVIVGFDRRRVDAALRK